MTKRSKTRQVQLQEREAARAARRKAFDGQMALPAQPILPFHRRNIARPVSAPRDESPQQVDVVLEPLLEESLRIGNDTVNFDASMRGLVELTTVGLPVIRKAAESVHRSVHSLGLAESLPTHTYLKTEPARRQFTFGFAQTEEITAGTLRINGFIFCFGPVISQNLVEIRECLTEEVRSGRGNDISVQEGQQYFVIDQLSHEFTHAFGVRPGIGRLRGCTVGEVEELADAVAIWAIAPDDPRAHRPLALTGFTRLASYERVRVDRELREWARDVLGKYRLLPKDD